MSSKGRQFSSRFWEPYDELVVEKAKAARLKPNQLVRLATMAFVDPDLLSIHERVCEIDRRVKHLQHEQARLTQSINQLLGT